MKRRGLLNAPLSGALARLGHTDEIVVADCGLPVPRAVPVVDLAVTFALPRFLDVLDVVLEEVVVEAATAAREVLDANADCHRALTRRFGEVALVDHAELKRRAAEAALVVRTGEATPYANVLLRCGVPFG